MSTQTSSRIAMTDTDTSGAVVGEDYETQSGTTYGYQPMWLDGDEWSIIPTVKNNNGIPYPIRDGGLIEHTGLYGEAQAQALAWHFAAVAVSMGPKIEVKVRQLKITYEWHTQIVDELACD